VPPEIVFPFLHEMATGQENAIRLSKNFTVFLVSGWGLMHGHEFDHYFSWAWNLLRVYLYL